MSVVFPASWSEYSELEHPLLGRSRVAVLCIMRYWVIPAASINDYLAFGCNAGESHWLRIYLYLGDASQQE